MNKYVAEMAGTFALVYAGTGAIIANGINGGAVGLVGIALTFGLVIMAIIYAFGDISGAHLNPAVTIAFWVSGRFPTSQVVPYIIAQIIGAFIATGLHKVTFPDVANLGVTNPSGSTTQSFILEVVLTFLLMVVIVNVATGAKEKGIMAGIAIGGTIIVDILFGGTISGASMNPARSLAPAVLSGDLQHLWIYLAAPILGAIIAVPISNFIMQRKRGEDINELNAQEKK